MNEVLVAGIKVIGSPLSGNKDKEWVKAFLVFLAHRGVEDASRKAVDEAMVIYAAKLRDEMAARVKGLEDRVGAVELR